MRTHEPCLAVSPSGSDETVAAVNFTNDHLSRETKLAMLFKPKIRKGFIAKKGWMFGVCIAGQAHFSKNYEDLAVKVESFWVSFWDSTLDEDFDFCLAITEWHKENGIDWPVS